MSPTRFVPKVAAFALATSLGACAGAPPQAEVESTSQAVLQTEYKTFDNGDVANYRDLIFNIRDFTISTVKGPKPSDGWFSTITPSQGFSRYVYGENDPSKVAMKFELPHKTIKRPWYEPDITIWFDDVQIDFASADTQWTDALRVGFNYNTIDLDAKATIHARAVTSSALTPDSDFVANATVHASLLIDSTHHLVLDPDPTHFRLAIDLKAENCGAFDWCAGLINDMLPDVSSDVAKAVRPVLADQLAQANAKDPQGNILQTVLEKKTRIEKFDPADPTNKLNTWRVPPENMYITASVLNYRIERMLPPAAPPSCTADVLCDDQVAFTCNSVEPVFIYRTSPVAPYSPLVTSAPGTLLTLTDLTLATTDGSAAYTICAQNTAGVACAGTTVLLPHTPCTHVATGGGGKTGCTKSGGKTKNCYSTGD